MDVPPPEPSSAAAIVEAHAEETILEELGAEVDAGAAPIDRRADRRQVRRERWRLLLRRPGFVIGVIILLWWIVCAIGGDRITPYPPLVPEFPPLEPPNSTNWMGTDQLGRDVLSRVMAGARDVLIAAPIAAVLSVVAGTLLGLLMGYRRGWVDEVLGRLVEALLAIPVVLMGILIASSLGSSRTDRDPHGCGAVHTDRDPHRARRGDRRGAARLRHVGPAAWRVRPVRDDQGDLPERHRADRRRAHRARRLCRVHDRHAVVPRVRDPATVARLGADGERHLPLHPAGPVVADACSPPWRSPAWSSPPTWSPTRSRRCWQHERDDHDHDHGARPRRRGPPPGLQGARHPARGAARRHVPRPSRRGLRAGRRVRLRQVDDGVRRGALPAVQRGDHRRSHPRRRRRRDEDVRARAAPVPRPRGVDGVPGPRDGAEPEPEGRTPGRRGVHRARPRQEGVRGDGARRAAPGAHRRPGPRHAALPAPALRRHAAACRDRHGPGVRPQAARPRRTDHRPRRHGRGRSPRPRPRAAPGDRRGDPADRPQPRCDPLDVRPRRRDVRRQGRRGGRCRRGLRAAQAPVHDRAAAVPAPSRRAQERAGPVHDPRHAAADRHRPADVRLRRPLRAGRRDVPHGRARRRLPVGDGATSAAATTSTASIRSPNRRSRRTSTCSVGAS